MLSLWHASRVTVRSQSRSDIFTLKLTRLSVLSLRLRLSPSPLITSRKIRRWAQNWAQSRKAKNRMLCKLLVRKEGLEPSRFYPPDPKSGASANSATFAYLESITCHATDCAFSTVAGACVFWHHFKPGRLCHSLCSAVLAKSAHSSLNRLRYRGAHTVVRWSPKHVPRLLVL